MKKLYLIGGTMGVGKTAVCTCLKKKLQNSVFLDGDWCWDANPFVINEETKRTVLENITYLLNNFLRCTVWENVIFCWVMHEQSIIDDIIKRLDTLDVEVIPVSLLCDEKTLRQRLGADVERGLREKNVIARSVARIPMYAELKTVKIDTTGKKIAEVADEIISI